MRQIKFKTFPRNRRKISVVMVKFKSQRQALAFRRKIYQIKRNYYSLEDMPNWWEIEMI